MERAVVRASARSSIPGPGVSAPPQRERKHCPGSGRTDPWRRGSKDQAVSERLPVARVAVDISLAHLDRPFDYLVPASMDEMAVPGCRVRVRFAGQLVDGYLLDRTRPASTRAGWPGWSG